MNIPFSHVIYIPLILAVGVFIGWTLGSASSRKAVEQMRQRIDTLERDAAEQRLKGNA